VHALLEEGRLGMTPDVAAYRQVLDDYEAAIAAAAARFEERVLELIDPKFAELMAPRATLIDKPGPSEPPARTNGAGGATGRKAAPSVIPPAPRIDSPGQGRRDGVPPTSRTEGTPAPASNHVTCPECGQRTTPHGLPIHRSKAHGIGPTPKASSPRPGAARDPDAKDPREIDEDCPRGCGRHFRWEPSLLAHARNCDGKAA
jgi:hypothetical protein